MDRNIENNEQDIQPREQEPKSPGQDIPKEEARKNRPERRRYEYKVTELERSTLAEIGRFRTVNLEDIARFLYQGNAKQMAREMESLSSQGLIRKKTIWPGKENHKISVATLTKEGKKYLERNGEEGVFYAGFVKPTEMAHDSAIYRMYQAELQKITQSGGQMRTISLDYELKKHVFSQLSKEKPNTAEYRKRQKEIAAEHGLKVVGGHIQLPDLRIEYLTREGKIDIRDLELATTHYRGGSLAAKAEAGFAFYAAGADAGRLSSIFDDHNITAEIFNL